MNTLQDKTYYKATDYDDINKFIISDKYTQFKDEYESAIDSIIVFYSTYAEKDDNKNIVKAELDKLKERLFGNNALKNEGHKRLSVLFEGKEAMESIAQALIPEEGLPFESEEIKWKLIHIFNLAGKQKLSEQSSCMVCAPGTVRNFIETAQLLQANMGNLINKVKVQRKIIITDIIKKYIFITHNKEIRQRVGGAIHDTNLMNAFVNALDKKLGLEQVDDVYAIKSSVTGEDKVNINREIELAVTENNITEQLAKDYLRRVSIEIQPEKGQFIDYKLASDTLEKLKFTYGDYSFYDVFTINDNNQLLGITTDPTAIKVEMLHFIKQDPTINMYPLTWSTDTLISDNGQGKKLWRSGDLFWTELTDNLSQDKKITLPSAQDLGKKYINKIGYSQLQQIIEQSQNPSAEDTAIFFQLNLERLYAADEKQLSFFFSKLGTTYSNITKVQAYITQNLDWFKILVEKNGENPLIPYLLTHLKSDELITLEPSDLLYSISEQQFTDLFFTLEPKDSIDRTIRYVTKYSAWFSSLVKTIGKNPLFPELLKRLSPEQLATLEPDIALYNITKKEAESFLLELDDDNYNMTKACKYVTQHPEWFTALVKKFDNNPLASRLLARLTEEQLVNIKPDIILQHLTARQTQTLFRKLNGDQYDITKGLKYATQNKEWFKTLVDRNGKNPLAQILLEHPQKQEITRFDPNIALYGLSDLLVRRFFTKLNNDLTNIKTYVSLHKEWFASLINKLGKNPLLPLWSQLTTKNKMELDPNIILQNLSKEEVKDVISSLSIRDSSFRRLGFLDTTQAQTYITKYSEWFKTQSERNGENVLISSLLKNLPKEELITLDPNIMLVGLSARQATDFFFALSRHHKKVLKYISQHKQWFIDLVERVGENPLIPLLINLKPKELMGIDPDIVLQGLSKEQAELFFARLSHKNHLSQARDYVKRYANWFTKLVYRTGENPITPLIINEMVGNLYTILPDDFSTWGMSAHQASLFLACMDTDDSINRAMQYVIDNPKWFNYLVKETGENPITPLLLARLSSDALMEQPPEIALLGLSEQQSRDFLSRLLPENATNYVQYHHQWFKQQAWDIHALLSGDYHTLASEPIPLDIRPANYWKKPQVEPRTDGGTMRFDGQVIIQLENDPIACKAAAQLAGKHPNNSVIIQLDQYGNNKVVYGNLKKMKGSLRWQLVGHSRGGKNTLEQTLGGHRPEALASQLGRNSDLHSSPEHISLVGCALAYDDTTGSYVSQFATALIEQNIYSTSIAAYETKLAVNEQGQKRLTETGEKVILTRYQGEWTTTKKAGKIDPEGVGRELLASLRQADNFQYGMEQLYNKNGLSAAEWLPMLHTLKKEGDNSKNYSLTFIQRNKKNTTAVPKKKTISINDPHITNFIHQYDKQLARTRADLFFADGQLRPRTESGITEVEGIHGLNSAFILQAWFMQRARNAEIKDPLPNNLKTALQIHTYANFAMIGQGALDDGVKFIQLSKELIQEGSAASGVFKAFSHLGAGAGIGINFISIGIDSYELAHAQNEAQRAIFGTQLAFDLANLTVCTVSLGAGFAGAATLSSFLGPLAVPLAGLGIGITALVMTTEVHVEKTKTVGRYFAELDNGYNQGGYQCVNVKAGDGTEHQTWRNHAGIAIKTLDLRLGHQILTYADTYIYKTHINGIGSGYDNYITMALPQSEKRRLGKSAVVNIREGIDHRFAAVSFAPDEKIPLVLPDTPQYYLDYHYDTFPGVTSRHDTGFDVLRRIESNYRSHSDNFSFDFYCFPSEYAISELKAEYVATPVQVLLDDATRTIIMPTQSKETKDKMAYTLTGGNGTYHISLQEGASLKLEGGSAKTNWILDARSLNDNLTFNSSGQLCVGDIKITLAADFQGSLQLTNREGLFAAYVQKQQISLLNADVDASRFKDPRLLHDYLKQVTHTDLHNQPFVPVEDYLTPQNERVGRAFYEAAKDRFIFTREPTSAEFLRGAQLVTTDGDTAWFYRDSSVWLVDITSGEVLREYVTLDVEENNLPSESKIIQTNEGNFQLIVKYNKSSESTSYTWLLTPETMTLISITGEERDVMPKINNFLWESVAQFSDTPKVIATLGKDIHLLVHRETNKSHYWLKKQEGKQKYELSLQMNMAKNTSEDIQLIPVQVGDKTSYYFYSAKDKKLYFQSNNGLSKNSAIIHEVSANIDALFTLGGQLMAQQNNEGKIWLANDQGELYLMGLTANWLLKHRENLMENLRLLTTISEKTLPVLRLQGLSDHQGKPIMTWYDIAVDKVVHSGAGILPTHTLHYRGLSPDGKQAWLYDDNSKALYRQPLTPETLFQFNEQGQSTTSPIQPAQRWSSWQYSSVRPTGDKLHLTREDGAILSLLKTANEQDKAQLVAWQVNSLTDTKKIEIKEAIEILDDQVILPLSIRCVTDQVEAIPTWYLTKQNTFLYAYGLSGKNDLYWLGQAAGEDNHYIHDQTTGDLWLTNNIHSTSHGRYSFIFQAQDQLILEISPTTHMKEHILPRLIGVERLALSGKTEGARYLLNAATLNHYQQILIDEQGNKPIIQLPESLTSLLVSSSGEDLILYDPSSNTRIAIINAEQAAQRKMKFEISGIPAFDINHLVHQMYRLNVQIPDLNPSDRKSAAIELRISPTDSTIEYHSLHSDQKISHKTHQYEMSETETHFVNLSGTMSTFGANNDDPSGMVIDHPVIRQQQLKSTYYNQDTL